MNKLATFAIVAMAVLLIATFFVFQRKRNPNPTAEPFNISGWKKVSQTVVTERGLLLNGDAVNYGNGRPYKLHLGKGTEARNVWYAEFLDNGEWYETDIGENK